MLELSTPAKRQDLVSVIGPGASLQMNGYSCAEQYKRRVPQSKVMISVAFLLI